MAGEFDGTDLFSPGTEFGVQGTLPGYVPGDSGTYSGAGNLPGGGGTDFGGVLSGIANPLLDVGKTVLSLQVMRDTIANQAADRQLDRYAKTLQLAGAKQQLDVNAGIAGIKAQTALVQAQQGLAQLVSKPANQQMLLVLLAIVGTVIAYLQLRKSR